MDYASKIALLTGFGGVLLGGAITYLSEVHFRNQEARKKRKKDIMLVGAEIGRTYTELQSILKNLAKSLPEEQPIMLWPMCRPIIDVDTPESNLSIETLFAVGSKDVSYFGEIELYLRRFNSNLRTFKKYNNQRMELNSKVHTLRLALDEDLARVEFDLNDTELLKEIHQIENLLRAIFRYFSKDLEDGRKLTNKVNKLWRDKHSKKGKNLLELSEEVKLPAYLKNISDFTLRDLTKTAN